MTSNSETPDDELESIIDRRSMQKFRQSFPPGVYWVGDLCYTLGDDSDLWQRMHALSFRQDREEGSPNVVHSQLEGEFQIDGFRYAEYFTEWGDGRYLGIWHGVKDYKKFSFSVDAGIIGIAPIEWLKALNLLNIPEDPDGKEYNFGKFYTFDYSFRTESVNGVIKFGQLEIDTANFLDEEESFLSDWFG